MKTFSFHGRRNLLKTSGPAAFAGLLMLAICLLFVLDAAPTPAANALLSLARLGTPETAIVETSTSEATCTPTPTPTPTVSPTVEPTFETGLPDESGTPDAVTVEATQEPTIEPTLESTVRPCADATVTPASEPDVTPDPLSGEGQSGSDLDSENVSDNLSATPTLESQSDPSLVGFPADEIPTTLPGDPSFDGLPTSIPVTGETPVVDPMLSGVPADVTPTPSNQLDPRKTDGTGGPAPSVVRSTSFSASSVEAAAIGSLPMVQALNQSSPVSVGTSVRSQASWNSAPFGKPTGTITYVVFSGTGCSGTQFAAAGTMTITSSGSFGAVAPSNTVTFSVAGTYSWRAVYNGNANYVSSSVCTDLIVSKLNPTLSLGVGSTNGPMRAGGTARGTASLNGETSTAGGTVTYSVYSDNGCTVQLAAPNSPSTVTVSNGSVPNSASITMNVAGTVYWKAVYSGDANNSGASSSCTSLSVSKARSRISLSVAPSVSPMSAGRTATGGVTFSRSTTTAGGTVTFTVYTNNGCSTQYTATGNPSAVTVTNRVAPRSTAISFPGAGTFYWRATYSGDANNNAANSSCVALTVAKASPTLSLSISPNPVTVGSTASAGTTVSGGSPTAGGTVTYTVYSNNTCTTQFTVTNNPSSKTVSAGIVPNSSSVTFTSIGTYYWRASYGGDTNNNAATSSCTAMAVSKATPSISLTVTPASSPMLVNGSASGAASLVGATASAGGTVTYTVYSNNACTTALIPAKQTTKTVTSGVVPGSGLLSFSTAGTFYWSAAYSGDASNSSSVSSCVGLTVLATAASSISLSVSPNPVQVGATSTGTASLTGITATAGGTVVYTLYSDSGCNTQVSPSQQVTRTVSNGLVANSGTITFSSAGIVYWKAIFSGDALNSAATSPCVALTVSRKSPSLSLTVGPNPTEAGVAVRGNSALSGATGNAGGTVTYAVFTDNACTSAVVPAQQSTTTVVNGVVPNSAPITMGSAGTLFWQATYSGDANNSAASSNCQTLVVNKAAPTLTMNQAPAVVIPGGAFTEQLSLSVDAVNPTGTVTISTFDDSGCTSAYSAVPPVTLTLSAGLIPSAPAVTYDFADDVYRIATYSGDANNEATSTTCDLVVVALDPEMSLTTLPGSTITRGQSATAQVTWPTDDIPTGTLTYTLFNTIDCSGTAVGTSTIRTIDEIANTVTSSSAEQFPVVGVFSWRAIYSGDLDYRPVTLCASISVEKSTPTVVQAINPTAVTVGGSAGATSTLGNQSPTAGGTVTYSVFNSATCATPLAVSGNPDVVTVANGVVPHSSLLTFTGAGTVYWRTTYSGDANNNPASSACQPMTVQQSTPQLSISQQPNPVGMGEMLTTRLVLSPDAYLPTGSATLRYFTNVSCSTPISGLTPLTVNLVNFSIPDSTPITYTFTNGLYLQATYSGDLNNAATTSACIKVVARKDLALGVAITPANSILRGSTAAAQATWPAIEIPGGTVTYRLFGAGDCTGNLVAGPETLTISSNMVPASTAVVLPTAGSYGWQASYSGDTEYQAISVCVPFSVQKTTPTIGLTLLPDPIRIGDQARARATLTDLPGNVTGTMTYDLFVDSGCSITTQPAHGSLKSLSSGVIPDSDVVSIESLGTFYWRATYSGDANHNPAQSPCVEFVVGKAAPAIQLTQSPGGVAIGAEFVTGMALSSAAFNPSGSVTLTRYIDENCQIPLTGVTEYTAILVSGAIADAPPLTFNFGGPIYQRAEYSGDANNLAAFSPCTGVVLEPGVIGATMMDGWLPTATYAHENTQVDGEITIVVTDTRASWSGWSVTISSSEFEYSGPSPDGIAIPANGFTIIAGGEPLLVSGQPVGPGGPVTAPAIVGPLDQARTLLTAAPGFGTGVYELTIPVSLVIPAQSEVGTYTSTVTVTVSVGP